MPCRTLKEATTPKHPTSQTDHTMAQCETLEHSDQHHVSGDNPPHDTYKLKNETVDHEDVTCPGTPEVRTPPEQHTELHDNQIMELQTATASDTRQEADNSTTGTSPATLEH